MDIAVIETFATLGIGAVLAIVVMYWKRQDDKEYRRIHDESKEEILRILTDYRDDNRSTVEVLSKNNQALAQLTTVVERMTNYHAMEQRLRELERQAERETRN